MVYNLYIFCNNSLHVRIFHYIVFSDASLYDMCAKIPETDEEFLEVSGVGQAKLARYGEAFLAAIAEYREGCTPITEKRLLG